MSESNFDLNDVDFFAITGLLEQGVTIAQLATAIEKEGIQGWDRYGRYKVFKKDDREFTLALDFLAGQYEWQSNVDNCQSHAPSPLDQVDIDHPACLLGWSRATLPKFGAQTEHIVPEPRRPEPKNGAAKRLETADLALIGALLAYVSGKTGQPAHPHFSNEQQLITFLAETYTGFYGVTTRTMQTKFSEAKKLLAGSGRSRN
jgi:hypothetical protein